MYRPVQSNIWPKEILAIYQLNVASLQQTFFHDLTKIKQRTYGVRMKSLKQGMNYAK